MKKINKLKINKISQIGRICGAKRYFDYGNIKNLVKLVLLVILNNKNIC